LARAFNGNASDAEVNEHGEVMINVKSVHKDPSEEGATGDESHEGASPEAKTPVKNPFEPKPAQTEDVVLDFSPASTKSLSKSQQKALDKKVRKEENRRKKEEDKARYEAEQKQKLVDEANALKADGQAVLATTADKIKVATRGNPESRMKLLSQHLADRKDKGSAQYREVEHQLILQR
jgi:hypothetical protein